MSKFFPSLQWIFQGRQTRRPQRRIKWLQAECLEDRLVLAAFVNAGGPAVTAGGKTWLADTNGSPSSSVNAAAIGNTTFSTTQSINLTDPSIPSGTPASLFQTERWDDDGSPEMQWDFAVAPGQYEVRLYFAEIYSGTQSVGARKFDVTIEGQLVLNDYDVYADVGGYKGVVKTFQVTSDNNLDINFAHVTENPAIKAIEIIDLASPNANKLGASGTSLSYPNVTTNTTSTQTLTLTNLGTAGDPSITINGATISGANASLFGNSLSSPITLTPGQSTTINVTYSPTAAGSHQASIAFNHTGSNTPFQVSLSGTSTAPSANANKLGTSVTSLAFPGVTTNTTSTKTLTLTNLGVTGEPSITISTATISGTNASLFGNSLSSPITLTPGQSTTINVTYAPTAVGSHQAVMALDHSGSNTPISVGLSGTSTAPPTNANKLGTSVTSLAFPGVITNTTTTTTLTLTNLGSTGDSNITISGASISGANASLFGNSLSSPITLTPGQSTTINVTYSPTAAGSHQAAIAFNHSGTNTPISVSLSGTSTAPSANANKLGTSVTSLAFPGVTTNTTSTKTLTLTNLGATGEPSITISGATISGANASLFGNSLTGPITLSPGQSTTINVTYSPTAAGSHQAAIAFNHSGVNSPTSVALSGTSTAPPTGVSHFVNAGGSSVTAGGTTWLADTSGSPSSFVNAAATGNTTHSVTQAINLTDPSIPSGTPASVFQSERWDGGGSPEMQWDFAVTPGQYEVRLYFAEIYSGAQSVGARKFDVTIEGQLVLNDYDVYADVGGYKGVVKTFQVTSDAILDINFGHVTENPAIKAIAIVGQSTSQANQLGTSAASLTYTGVTLNTTSTKTLTFTNLGTTGDPAITVNGATISGANAALFGNSLSGPITLTPGQSTTINVTYTPTAAGTHQATIAISHSGSNTPLQVPLSGTAGVIPIGFGKSVLAGANPENPTSLQFGPDGRLYVATQDGLIYAYTIARNAANSYSVTATETITAIQSIPNHNDNGNLNAGVTDRLVTGLLVTGTAANPVIYVTSSDPRIGAGPSGTDLNLDTNSGILSRLTWNGSQWVKLDLVRGLPRSEENHTANGMQLDPATNTLYIAQGGNTNMGAPSGNFALLPEYALSAAILSVDLTSIGNTTYDLPTLNDEDRSGVNDANDPFGGNDGKNQAILVPGGPVQVYSPGYRNPYDLVLTASGRLYTIDNGSNSGWGDVPVTSNGTATTPATAGNATNQRHEPGITDEDNLHLVTQGFYAGHPNPTRASTANTFNSTNPQSPVSVGNPVEGAYLAVGSNDGSLAVFPDSTNGLTEYTASNFGGALKGDLLTASFSNQIIRIKLNASGTGVVLQEALFNSVGSLPLDVTAVGDEGPHPGTIWTGDIENGNIYVFEPNDFDPDGGPVDPNDLDGDGYSNDDEAANGTNPNSAADVPPDYDLDFLSNLLDPDDDNDNLPDTSDPFAIDPLNGRGTAPNVLYTWENNAPSPGGLLNLGFTGLMTNGTSNYESLYSPNTLTAGGAAGVLTIDSASEGDATGATNTQEQAFQFGINVTSSTGPVTVHSRVLSPFIGISPQSGQQMGLFLGTGNQDNYVRVVVDGSGSIQVISEINGVVTAGPTSSVTVPGPDAIDFYLTLDPAAATVQAGYALTTGGTLGSIVPLSAPIAVPNSWWTGATAPAVGIISTSAGSAPPFPATWDFMEVTSAPPPQPTVVHRVNAGGPSVTAGGTTWLADTSGSPSSFVNAAATGNTTFSNTQTINLTHPSIPSGTPASLFQTERWDSGGSPEMQWDFAVTPGQYEVRLYFAEIYSGAQSAGARKFDVTIEDQLVLNDYDVYAEVGGYKGVVKTFQVTSDSNLDINFAHVTENPAIKAIEVIGLSPPSSNSNKLGVSATSLAFPNVTTGTTSTQALTLTNLGTTGDPAITISGATISGANASLFGSSLSSSITLAPGQSTLINVNYTPIATGNHQAAMTIAHSGLGAPSTIALTGSAVAPSSGAAQALVAIDTGSSINSSTYNSSSFKVDNNSTGNVKIASVKFDLSTAVLPDMVFDPNGVAGDQVAKDFTVDSTDSVGVTSHTFLDPHDDGFDQLQVNFSDFNPGETFSFSVDVDPTSIRGTTAPGPNESGSVSGLELTGSTVTITFSDGTTSIVKPFRTASSNGASQVIAKSGAPAAPSIQVLGVGTTPAVVTNANQTIRVTGIAGTSVRLLKLEAGLYTAGLPGGGFDIDPFEANSVVQIGESTAVVGTSGFVDIPVVLTKSDASGGLMHFVAVTVGSDGLTSLLSNLLVLNFQS